MFFGNSRIICRTETITKRMSVQKKEYDQHNSMFKVLITSILFKCHRSINNCIVFTFFCCHEKAHDGNKEFSRENSNARRESLITGR